MVRKPDRNGNIIALITYKHIESVDYSIKLFDKILLFGQRLKVQLSNINQKVPATIAATSGAAADHSTSTSNTTSPNLANGYQKPYSRTQSYDSITNIRNHQPASMMHAPIIPPQFMQNMNGPLSMPLNFVQLMTQPLINFNDHQRYHNQSPSPNQHHHSRYDHHSRNHNQHHHRSRDNSYQSDARSRSPRNNNRRR